jgi:hypothetical protein
MSGKEKNCNYQDNLFFVGDIIRRTSTSLSLELDPVYWKEYILKDLGFLLKVLEEISSNLKANTLLITRLNSLNDLNKVLSLYLNLLDIIGSGAFPVCTAFEADKSRLTAFSTRAQELSVMTKELMKEESAKNMNTDHETVSENEYKFLFSEENASE